MQLSVTLGGVPACWVKERAGTELLAAWHCWDTGPKELPGSLQPGAQARTCHLLCPVFRASMRVLAIIFCHQGHDQDNVWEVKWLRIQLNKKRTFHTRQLSKTSRVTFNEFRFSGTVGQPVEKRDSGTGIFLNRQQGYFKDSSRIVQASFYIFKHLSFR